MIVSEIYVLEDLLYYDHAISSDYNDNTWSTWTSYPCTITRGDTRTVLTQATSGTTGYHIFPFSTLNPTIIEFDMQKVGGTLSDIVLQLRNNNRGVLKQVALSSFVNLALDTWYHVVFDFEHKTITVGNSTVSMEDISPTNLYFAVNGSTTSVDYKNFKVY